MKYWLTTHWPPRVGDPSDRDTEVWLPDGREEAATTLSPGDLIMVYETASGPTEIRTKPTGSTHRVRRQKGKARIICYGCLTGSLSADPQSSPQAYVGRGSVWWRWRAPVEVLSRSGFVPLADVLAVLGYKPSYNLHGYGRYHSGLGEISATQFAELKARFHTKRPLHLPVSKQPQARTAGGGGESALHKNLKNFVAADPSAVLGENGLRTLHVEYPFPTSDKADIVLADANARIIGVEIELRVGNKDYAGPLQAIKYRRMLEWITDRSPGDSRAMLIAYSITPEMHKRCANYEIECYEVKKSQVRAWASKTQATT